MTVNLPLDSEDEVSAGQGVNKTSDTSFVPGMSYAKLESVSATKPDSKIQVKKDPDSESGGFL